MSKRNGTAILAVLFVLAGQVGAQNLPEGAAEPRPVIHATVDAVALDVVVRDKKGRLVKYLASGDVEIYEDGLRQQIQSFRLVTGGDAPAAQAIPLPAVNLVCIVFHNLDPVTRKWAVAAAEEYINTQLRPGAWVGIFNLDARLTALYPFSRSR